MDESKRRYLDYILYFLGAWTAGTALSMSGILAYVFFRIYNGHVYEVYEPVRWIWIGEFTTWVVCFIDALVFVILVFLRLTRWSKSEEK